MYFDIKVAWSVSIPFSEWEKSRHLRTNKVDFKTLGFFVKKIDGALQISIDGSLKNIAKRLNTIGELPGSNILEGIEYSQTSSMARMQLFAKDPDAIGEIRKEIKKEGTGNLGTLDPKKSYHGEKAKLAGIMKKRAMRGWAKI